MKEPSKRLLSLVMALTMIVSLFAVNMTVMPTEVKAAETVKLSTTSTVMGIGEYKKITLKNAVSGKVKWTTSDSSVAKIYSTSSTGKTVKVKSLKKGSAYITAKNLETGKSYKCKVTVKKASISKKTLYLQKGKKSVIKIKNSASSYKWSVSNKSVAKITSKTYGGRRIKVYGKKKGTCTLTATNKTTGKKYKCTVYVNTISKSSLSMGKSETYTLKAGFVKKGSVKWYSSNKSVATVDQNGKVTSKKYGTAYIYAKCGKAKVRCRVKVEKFGIVEGTGSRLKYDSSTNEYIFVTRLIDYYFKDGESVLAGYLDVVGTTKNASWSTSSAAINITKGGKLTTKQNDDYYDDSYTYRLAAAQVAVGGKTYNVKIYILSKSCGTREIFFGPTESVSWGVRYESSTGLYVSSIKEGDIRYLLYSESSLPSSDTYDASKSKWYDYITGYKKFLTLKSSDESIAKIVKKKDGTTYIKIMDDCLDGGYLGKTCTISFTNNFFHKSGTITLHIGWNGVYLEPADITDKEVKEKLDSITYTNIVTNETISGWENIQNMESPYYSIGDDGNCYVWGLVLTSYAEGIRFYDLNSNAFDLAWPVRFEFARITKSDLRNWSNLGCTYRDMMVLIGGKCAGIIKVTTPAADAKLAGTYVYTSDGTGINFTSDFEEILTKWRKIQPW